MILQINGESRSFPDGLTVASLVTQLGMKPDRVAVELNLEIVPRTNWETTHLQDGDKLEIVHFVGGGSDSALELRIGPRIPQLTSPLTFLIPVLQCCNN